MIFEENISVDFRTPPTRQENVTINFPKTVTNEQQEIIKTALTSLLQMMDISAETDLTISDEDVPIFNIRTPDSAMLIGQHGANLGALQHLVRILVAKKIPEPVHFIIDVEGYKRAREEFLRELSRQAAARVRDTKESLLLKPMMAYERRVVHSEIGKLPDLSSESVGEEPERRILIKLRV
ncbi:MAG: Single-stranded nucleic acid binding R3H domain-containing protein [Parcubacteria group bacterium GW2011_GWA2_51_12]|nr:MAG: Single-stranded nucleic acid binding R3H domain-containing protein [Parcubacteria group bacterium GW2011_GWA2_51_12]